MRWDGAVAIVTGASRGIGREVARMASERGARVGLVARTRPDLEAVLDEVGGRGAVATADMGERDQAEAAIAQLAEQLGPADILVNNAGVGAYGPVSDTPVEEFERLMRVNYFSAIYATKAVLASMIERRRGHIVNLASVAGRFGAPLEAAYSASKFAMVGFTESLALEVGAKGVGVSMVNPGPVNTEFFERRGHPYARSRPKPVSAARVAAAVMDVVEHNRLERIIPSSLRPALVFKDIVPPLYRFGASKAVAGYLPET